MANTATWPDETTMIPELLAARPQTRAVLDRYGLKGCGGPQGPVETLGFFARAHGVALESLLTELRGRAALPSVPLVQIGAAPRQIELDEIIYRPFFKAGIATVLTLGAVWGAYLLLRIGVQGTFTSVGLHEVNAHGHAQIFGWVGLFVMGFAYQAFPRFKHAALAHPQVAVATLWMMIAGVVARSICQPLASEMAGAWWIAVAGSVLEVAAATLFVWVLAATWRASGKPLAFYDYYIAAALSWFVVQAIYESVYLTATLSARGADLVNLAATWQAPLRDAQIHGFALLMILGVSQRIFHHFYALPQPSQRLSLAILPILNLAVLGEMSGLVLMRTAGHAWAALWYGSVLVLALATAILVKNWRIFSPAEDVDRSLKFLRVAYLWLFVAMGMLVVLPAYQFGLLAWLAPASDAARLGFSHAYYGAARHAITVGFVSLMIVGVAAKIVPTLNGVNSRSLSALWGPFLLINAGCTLRVTMQTLTDFTPHAYAIAGVSGLLEVTGLALWGAHLWLIMAGRARLRPQTATVQATTSSPTAAIHAGSVVGTVLEQRPELLDTFLAFGFSTLASPQFRSTIARVVTIGQACRRMGVDVDQFLTTLNGSVATPEPPPALPFVPLAALMEVARTSEGSVR